MGREGEGNGEGRRREGEGKKKGRRSKGEGKQKERRTEGEGREKGRIWEGWEGNCWEFKEKRREITKAGGKKA